MHRMGPKINPASPAPQKIIAKIIDVTVEYIDINGHLHQGVIEVNEKVASDVDEFFKTALKLKFPICKVARSSDSPFVWDDARLMEANVSSGFNYRYITSTQTISNHGQGLAIDINPAYNPIIYYEQGDQTKIYPKNASYDISRPGTLYSTHPLVVLLKNTGWEWGGDWLPSSGRVDYQHFEKLQDETSLRAH